MSKTSVRLAHIDLSGHCTELDQDPIFNGMVLVQQGLQNLGYNVLNQQRAFLPHHRLKQVKHDIDINLAYLTNGIPTNTRVQVKSGPGPIYALMFFN